MATIYKRGRIWWLAYKFRGRRVQRSIGPSKRIAQLAKQDIEVRIAKDRADLPINYRINDWHREFVIHVRAHLRPGSVTRYEEVLRFFLDFLNIDPDPPIYLCEITPRMVEAYKLHRLTQGRAKKTVNLDLVIIGRWFNLAIHHGYCTRNPLREIEPLTLSNRQFPRCLNQKELQLIFNTVSPRDKRILQVLVNTGMRWGELRHLEWKDVDLNSQTISICPKAKWSPKGGRERVIPMNPIVHRILSALPQNTNLVFPSPVDSPVNRNHLRERLQVTCERLGIPRVTLHTFRHTFCSHLVMAGVDLPTVAKLAGHTDIKTTMIYSHLARDHVKQAVTRISLGDG